jgi:hypothetical protein
MDVVQMTSGPGMAFPLHKDTATLSDSQEKVMKESVYVKHENNC